MDERLDRAAEAIRDGEAVIYPTETVYGLGADALDPDAVERVYELKGRDRSEPISLAVPDADAALEYVDPTDREREFMEEFLPGPVTVVCRRRSVVPDVLTAGSDRVGVRVPDHDLALALLERVAPLPVTATSANRSGQGSAREVGAIDPELRDAVAGVVDAGRTPGSESTVVDVVTGEVIRPGAMAERIQRWLAEE